MRDTEDFEPNDVSIGEHERAHWSHLDDPFADEAGFGPVEFTPDTREEEGAFVPPTTPPVGTINMVAEPPRSRTWSVQVFSPTEAAAQFREKYGETGLRMNRGMQEDRPARQLHDLVHDTSQGRRRLPMGTAAQLEALTVLMEEMPNARHVVTHILAAVAASQRAKVPIRIDPLVLLGPPGGGKTRLCRRISESLNATFRRISMPNATGGGTVFSGTDATWKTCRPSVIADLLMRGETASPLIMLDEIDKSYVHPSGDAPLDPLHDLWEPENAQHFRDEAFGIQFDASHVFWIATANDVSAIRPSLLDRALVLTVSAPTRADMETILNGMYVELSGGWCAWFDDDPLPNSVLDSLRDCHPRLARRVLASAMTIAASTHRHGLIANDIDAALALWQPQENAKMGFV